MTEVIDLGVGKREHKLNEAKKLRAGEAIIAECLINSLLFFFFLGLFVCRLARDGGRDEAGRGNYFGHIRLCRDRWSGTLNHSQRERRICLNVYIHRFITLRHAPSRALYGTSIGPSGPASA